MRFLMIFIYGFKFFVDKVEVQVFFGVILFIFFVRYGCISSLVSFWVWEYVRWSKKLSISDFICYGWW